MNLGTTAYHLGLGWVRTQVLGQQLPLLTSWNLTFHCNKRCIYCASPTLNVPELKTAEVLRGIDEFYRMGMRWVTFSGGEPLLRNDIGQLVNHCKDKGITTFISTNGTLLPRRIDEVARVDRITISLDGASDVHDAVRGKGSWDEAVRAIAVCKERGIRVATTCVLSAQNLDTTDDLLAFLEKQGVVCMFQPATKWLDSGTEPNPIAPDTEPYRKVIDTLVTRKRAGAPIANSIAGLKVLRKWPEPTPIRSTAGGITCTVEPDGKVLASHLTETANLEKPREDTRPPWELFREMPVLKSNTQPWCAPILELDLLFALNPSAAMNAFRVQR